GRERTAPPTGSWAGASAGVLAADEAPPRSDGGAGGGTRRRCEGAGGLQLLRGGPAVRRARPPGGGRLACRKDRGGRTRFLAARSLEGRGARGPRPVAGSRPRAGEPSGVPESGRLPGPPPERV
ncbi:MAG: hypothetical protein AVDCRST_MAG02-3852, partial [uncultured Rubrobacteraceae bacterium]